MFCAESIIKPVVILSIIIASTRVAFAQKDSTFYMKSNYVTVSTRDSANYIRVVGKADSAGQLYNVNEYYLNGKPKLIGKTSKLSYNVLEGLCTTFFPSGIKKETATYQKGNITGDIYNYYPNGKLYTKKRHLASSLLSDNEFDYDYAIETCNDSIEKPLVINGQGHYIGFDEGFNVVRSEGEILNKLKNGEWKGNFPASHAGTIIKQAGNDSIAYTENYIKGKLTGGTSVDGLGSKYEYTYKEIIPVFKGGEAALGNFLTKKVKYPQLAKENNVQGKVYVTFVIEKDGSLSDLKVVRNPGSGLGEESARVISLSPPWMPGIQYGRPVRVQYTMPINFTLGN